MRPISEPIADRSPALGRASQRLPLRLALLPLLLLLPALLALAGCGGGGRSAPADPLDNLPKSGTGSIRWVSRLASPDSGLLTLLRVTPDGTLYATRWNRHKPDEVVAVDAATGTIRWVTPAGNRLVFTADGLLLAYGQAGDATTAMTLSSLDPTSGAIRWQREVGAPRRVAVYGNEVVVSTPGTGDTGGIRITAFDTGNGQQNWQQDVPTQQLKDYALRLEGSALTLYLLEGGSGQNLSAVDARTGTRLWQRPIARGLVRLITTTDNRLLALFLFVPTNPLELPHLRALGLDPATGEQLWEGDDPIGLTEEELPDNSGYLNAAGPYVPQGNVYKADVLHISARTGRRVWTAERPSVPDRGLQYRYLDNSRVSVAADGSILYREELAYSGTPADLPQGIYQSVSSVDAETGKLRWTVPLYGKGPYPVAVSAAPVVGPTGLLYTQLEGDNGTVVALAIQ